jgi:predicted ester cyclase
MIRQEVTRADKNRVEAMQGYRDMLNKANEKIGNLETEISKLLSDNGVLAGELEALKKENAELKRRSPVPFSPPKADSDPKKDETKKEPPKA